jgi:hypothetical protein
MGVPVRWWLYVLLVPPALQSCVALLSFAFAGKPVAIDPAALLSLATPAMLVAFLFGPFGEEFGWCGFVLPRFVRRAAGVPHWRRHLGVWHWPLAYQAIVQAPGRDRFACVGHHVHELHDRRRISPHEEPAAGDGSCIFDSMLRLSPNLFPSVPTGAQFCSGRVGWAKPAGAFRRADRSRIAGRRARGRSVFPQTGEETGPCGGRRLVGGWTEIDEA